MHNPLEREITLPFLLRFTMPSMVMMVIMSLYTVVDGIFVSRLIGTDAFSAVNIVYPLLSVTIALGTMFGTGLTAIVSRKLGEGKEQEARRDLSFVVLVALFLGMAVTVVSYLLLPVLIRGLGADAGIYQDCWDYALPLVAFFAPSILQCLFQTLYVANGKPAVGLVVTILGGLTNVILDYVFIAECHWGIAGAAIATGLGYAVPTVFGFVYFGFYRKDSLYFVRPGVHWQTLLQTVANGSSEMVTNFSTSVTTLLFNLIMMRLLGSDGVAAISILLYLDFVLVAVSLGYSLGAAPLISYNYGRGDTDRLRRLFRLSAGFCAVIGLAVTVGAKVFARQLAGIFTPSGTPVYELAVVGLGIYAFGYLFKGYNVFASALFTAFGNGLISAILSFARTLVFLVVSLLGLSALFGLDGVWFSLPAAEAMAFALSLFFTLRYRRLYHYAD